MVNFQRMFAVLVLAFTARGIAQAPTAPTAEDKKTMEHNIELLHEEWNHHDMAAYTSHMTDDIQWVNVVGDWWKGKAQVFQTLDRYHKTIFRERQLYPAEKLSMRMIAPDVMVTTMINPADAYIGQNGIKQPPTRNVLTLVWVRRDGSWLIAQAQNTIEAPPAPPRQN